MNLVKRLKALEEKIGTNDDDRIEGFFIKFLSPEDKYEPARYATGEGMEFFAEDGETEDQFHDRIKAAMPKGDRIWRVLMYATPPD